LPEIDLQKYLFANSKLENSRNTRFDLKHPLLPKRKKNMKEKEMVQIFGQCTCSNFSVTDVRKKSTTDRRRQEIYFHYFLTFCSRKKKT